MICRALPGLQQDFAAPPVALNSVHTDPKLFEKCLLGPQPGHITQTGSDSGLGSFSLRRAMGEASVQRIFRIASCELADPRLLFCYSEETRRDC
jgi:hypothetical protein